MAGGPGKGQAESFLDKLDIQCVGVQVPYIQHLQSTLDERFLQVVPGTEVKLPPGPGLKEKEKSTLNEKCTNKYINTYTMYLEYSHDTPTPALTSSRKWKE